VSQDDDAADDDADLARQYDAAIAEGFAALRGIERRQAQPSATAIAAAVSAEIDRRERAAAEAQAEQEYAACRCPTGACAYCGLEAVMAVAPDGSSPGSGWHPVGGGHVCEVCWGEFHGPDAMFSTDADRRVGVIRMLLGMVGRIPWRAVTEPGAFASLRVYWAEHPGAPPVTTLADRFRHIDRDRLRRDFDAICNPRVDPPPDIKPRATPCPRCGVVRWRADFRSGQVGITEVCAGCGGGPEDRPQPPAEPRRHRLRQDWPVPGSAEADRMAATLLGVHEPTHGASDRIPGLALRAGFRWYWQTKRRKPNPEPWDHLDLPRMRRKAGLTEAVGAGR
jgi:hypothetical protein